MRSEFLTGKASKMSVSSCKFINGYDIAIIF